MAFDRNEAADVAFGHRPVLLDECMEGLVIRPGGIYLDGTLGRAGHSWEIVRRLNAGGRLIGLDRDETALEAARQRLAPYADRVTLVHSNFSRVAEVLDELGIPAVDGMLFDLGVSSPQLDDAQRGFSYMHDAPLDMRMDRTAGLTARTVVNEWSYEELRRILYEYGEERYAPAIARRIVAAREEAPIETTGQLVDLFCEAWGDGLSWINQSDGGPHEANFLKLDCSRVKRVFGWTPRWGVKDAIRLTVEWCREYEKDPADPQVTEIMDRQIGEMFQSRGL